VTQIKNILSISKEGSATVILEFEPGTNMDFVALEVRENFARIKNKLPPEIEKPPAETAGGSHCFSRY